MSHTDSWPGAFPCPLQRATVRVDPRGPRTVRYSLKRHISGKEQCNIGARAVLSLRELALYPGLLPYATFTSKRCSLQRDWEDQDNVKISATTQELGCNTKGPSTAFLRKAFANVSSLLALSCLLDCLVRHIFPASFTSSSDVCVSGPKQLTFPTCEGARQSVIGSYNHINSFDVTVIP